MSERTFQVQSKTCLGLKIDSCLKWDIHTSELMVSYNRKLNLLKSFYFLPIQGRLDFYFKVILPSITYGIPIRGSVGKTAFWYCRLEKIHIRAARIIHGYAWDTPALDVQRSANWRPLSLKLFYHLKLLSLVFNSYHNLSTLPLQNLYDYLYNFIYKHINKNNHLP